MIQITLGKCSYLESYASASRVIWFSIKSWVWFLGKQEGQRLPQGTQDGEKDVQEERIELHQDNFHNHPWARMAGMFQNRDDLTSEIKRDL